MLTAIVAIEHVLYCECTLSSRCYDAFVDCERCHYRFGAARGVDGRLRRHPRLWPSAVSSVWCQPRLSRRTTLPKMRSGQRHHVFVSRGRGSKGEEICRLITNYLFTYYFEMIRDLDSQGATTLASEIGLLTALEKMLVLFRLFFLQSHKNTLTHSDLQYNLLSTFPTQLAQLTSLTHL